ncbi:MAG: type II/IV secretion system protein [Gammaproteobacteria bacterium]|nr:type II/IV secretion system protein [Gammaproteobacteria bacterium]
MDSAIDGLIIRDHLELQAAVSAQKTTLMLPLGQILLNKKLINKQELEAGLLKQCGERSKRLGRILNESGIVTALQIRAALALKFGIPVIKLQDFDIAAEVLSLVPEEIAIRHNALPLAVVDSRLIVAMEDPMDQKRIEVLRFNTNQPIEPVMLPAKDIELALSKYYSKFDEDEALEDMIIHADLETRDHTMESTQAIEQQAKAKPIVRLLNAIVQHGVVSAASDINIRPLKERVDIYYRIDGKLHYSRSIHKTLLPALVSRIKITGRMNIAERRLPQDGHATLAHDGRKIDLRISVVPTVDGESVVMRILDKKHGIIALEQLGLSDKETEIIRALLQRPHGLFLVTGPTGSGKSTTLYALLNEIKKRKPHVITVEDPVEFDIEDVEQIQTIAEQGLNFAQALRHFLRHDPDVIMVGEIRDEETARIANKAAMTGHMVLSTLHTNDAASTVTRLVDMGVEPYLLSSTLLGVMSQRLVRLNCDKCLVTDTVDSIVRERLKIKPAQRLLRGKGCNACNNSGYRGRTSVCEMLVVNAEIARLINAHSGVHEIRRAAQESGMLSLIDSAVRLVREGKTSVTEVLALRSDGW